MPASVATSPGAAADAGPGLRRDDGATFFAAGSGVDFFAAGFRVVFFAASLLAVFFAAGFDASAGFVRGRTFFAVVMTRPRGRMAASERRTGVRRLRFRARQS